MSEPRCRGYECPNGRLIKAHIVPRGFPRDAQEGYPQNLLISNGSVRPLHGLGVYDLGILCSDCDRKLGALDQYALEVCRRFRTEHIIRDDHLFEMTNVDGDRFATFVLSVLWRASITSRIEFAKISLGAYEAVACEVIFGGKPLSEIPDYQLLIARYRQSGAFNPTRNYTMPARMTVNLAGWYFALNGFRMLAKLAQAPLPAELTPLSSTAAID